MAPLPQSVHRCPTLEAVDRAIEAGQKAAPRPYLGMSAIGDPCARRLWLGFHWVAQAKHDAAALKRFADGHLGEDIQADRLRMVPGITLITLDEETGGQIAFVDLRGHFRGHCDGMILGLVQAPKKWHVWEHKQVGEKKQAKLESLILKHGEKSALQAWDETYYAQACLYMHYSGLDRHYLTCSTPGGRHTIGVRTNADQAHALRLIARAERIIAATRPPPRVSEDPEKFPCKWCGFKDLCFGAALPARNCRTCLSATPADDGEWLCERHGLVLDAKAQARGCEDQRFIPDLVLGEQDDAAEDGSWISYRMPDGSTWIDRGSDNAS